MHPLIVGALLIVMPQDTGAFVVKLGVDTVSLERYKHTADRVGGDFVIRSPRSAHRIYTAELNADGTVRRYELVSHNIDGGPGPAETRQTIEFVGDSAVFTVPRGDSTVVTRIAVPRGTWPFQLHIYGLLEHIGRQARGARGDSVAISGVSFGANGVSTGVVRKRGGDTLQLGWTGGPLAGLGPFTFRLDPAGNLVWLTGKGSTVQVDVARQPTVSLGGGFAARPLGQLSPRDTARGTVSGADVWIDYSRPTKRGREIFGGLVPWNAVWRTGANAATQINTPADLVIAGATVPAGKYTLWTLPTPTGWTLIVNKQTGQWGTVYDAAQDLVRVDAKVASVATPVEQFTIAFEPGLISFTWDQTRVTVPVAKK